MKILSRYPLLALLWTVLTLSYLTSCSSHSDLYSLACADHALVMTGNMESVLENADCAATSSGIQLSAPLQRLVSVLSPGDRRDVSAVLEIKGIDLKHTLLAMSHDDQLCFAFKISDQSDFQEFLAERSGGKLQLAKEGDCQYYRFDPRTVMFIDDDMAVLLHSERVTVDAQFYQAYKENARQRPLLSWQKSALDEGKTLNVLASIPEINSLIADQTGINLMQSPQISKAYDLDLLKNGYGTIACSLQDLSLTIECCLVDNAGKFIPNYLDEDGTVEVNPSLLKYATEQDFMVAMAAVPQSIDWNSVLNEAVDMMGGPGVSGIDTMTTTMLSMLLSDLTGTVMLAAGPQSYDKIDHLYGWHAVVAAEMKEGKAAQYIDMLKAFVESNNQEKQRVAKEYKAYGWTQYQPVLLGCEYNDGKLAITIPSEGTLYAEARGNDFVASLSPISTSGGCNIGAGDFRHTMGGIVIDIPKDNPLITVFNFPFGCNFSYTWDGSSLILKAKQTETDGLFLNNLFELIAGQAH